MADSIRKQILAKVVAKLATIPSIGTVSKEPVHPLSLQAYPAVICQPMRDIPERGASSVNRRTWTLGLLCWVRPHVSLVDELEDLIRDVVGIMAMERWDNLAQDCREGSIDWVFLDSEAEEAGALIEWDIEYKTAITDSTAAPS